MEYSAENLERRAARGTSRAARVLIGIGWGVWQVIRWPVLTLLITLEPVARVVLGGFALLGTLTAFFFGAIHAPHFHFWPVLLVSQGCMAVLILYYAAIRLLALR